MAAFRTAMALVLVVVVTVFLSVRTAPGTTHDLLSFTAIPYGQTVHCTGAGRDDTATAEPDRCASVSLCRGEAEPTVAAVVLHADRCTRPSLSLRLIAIHTTSSYL